MKGVWNTPVEKGIWGGEEVSRVWPGQDQTSNYLLSVCQQWYHNVLHLMAWNSRHGLTCNTDHIGMECCMNFLTFRDTAHCQVNEVIGLLLWVFLNMALRYQKYHLTANIWTKHRLILNYLPSIWSQCQSLWYWTQ